MGTRSDNLPNGLYRDDDGSIGLIICPKCQRENYALNVALGYCTWCGYDANKDYNIHKDRLQYRIMYRINTVRILNKYDKNQVFI